MAFKIADGYVEVHAKHDRSKTRHSAQEAVDDAERVARRNEGSMLKWLFKVNPSLMRLLEAPIGSIFGSPIMLAGATVLAGILSGVLATALTTAILGAVGTGLVAAGIFALKKNEQLKKEWESTLGVIERSMARAAQPLLKPLIEGINYFEERFLRMEPAFKRLFTLAGPLIKPAIDAVMGFIEGMLPGLERAMPGIQTVFEAIAKHMPGLGTAIGDFIATIAANGPLLERVVGLLFTWLDIFFKVLGPVLVEAMRSFATTADIWSFITEKIVQGGRWIEDTWKKIPGWWNSTWGAVSGFFIGLWNDISGFFSNAKDATGSFFSSVGQTIMGWINSVGTWFSNLPGMIWNAIMGIPGLVGQVFQAMFDSMFYVIGFGAGLVVRAFTDLPIAVWRVTQIGFALVLGAIKLFADQMVNTVRGGFDLVRNLFSMALTNITTIARVGWENILRTGKNFIGNVIWAFTDLPPKLYGIARDTWNRVLTTFVNGAASAVRTARNFPTNMYNAVKSIIPKFESAGENAIRGLINGIGRLMGWAVDKARQAGARIAQGFKDALKIGSPSKLMADEVGAPIVQGAVQGIEDNFGLLYDAIGKIPNHFPTGDMSQPYTPVYNTPQSPLYGDVTVNVNVQNLTEIREIQAFLDGQLMDRTKQHTWAGNIYEATGQYERSYR